MGGAARSDGGNVPTLHRPVTKAMELRLKNQWFELAANRKASSIVLTLAFDPNEPVSIFEY